MAPIVLTQQEFAEAMEAGTSELKYLLSKEAIPDRYQAPLYHVGVTTVAKFASFCKDQDELRKILKEEIGLDSETGLRERVQVASFICAFRSASTRTEEIAKYEGEQEARQQTKNLPQSEYLAMKASFEAKWWKLEDVDLPARTFVEKRAEELEAGELRSECLTTVLNREQDDEDFLTPIFDLSGNLRVKKSTSNVPAPENPEALRRRIGISFNALMFLGLRHTNRPQIQGITPQLAPRYCEYLLGEHVWGLIAKDQNGLTISAPSWNLVLAYDAAIRKKAYRLMAEGAGDFTGCLKQAWMDPTTKERYFTTPMAIAASTGRKQVEVQYGANKRPANFAGGAAGKFQKGGKGFPKGGKGKGKGKGGKGGKSTTQCAAMTPDGQKICFSYNNAQVRCGKQEKCNFMHLCGICFQRHPMYQCTGNRTKAPETAGAGVQSS